MEGNPTGFQRWVNADNATGMTSNKIDECAMSLLGSLIFTRFRYYGYRTPYNIDHYLNYLFNQKVSKDPMSSHA
jgi:hypothetical protein